MVKIGDVEIGGERVVVMAGPCSVESRDQIERAADIVADGGAQGDSRRRVQAAQFALQLSGPGRRRPAS